MKKEVSFYISLSSTEAVDRICVDYNLLSDRINSLLIKYDYVDLKKLSNTKFLFIGREK